MTLVEITATCERKAEYQPAQSTRGGFAPRRSHVRNSARHIQTSGLGRICSVCSVCRETPPASGPSIPRCGSSAPGWFRANSPDALPTIALPCAQPVPLPRWLHRTEQVVAPCRCQWSEVKVTHGQHFRLAGIDGTVARLHDQFRFKRGQALRPCDARAAMRTEFACISHR